MDIRVPTISQLIKAMQDPSFAKEFASLFNNTQDQSILLILSSLFQTYNDFIAYMHKMPGKKLTSTNVRVSKEREEEAKTLFQKVIFNEIDSRQNTKDLKNEEEESQEGGINLQVLLELLEKHAKLKNNDNFSSHQFKTDRKIEAESIKEFSPQQQDINEIEVKILANASNQEKESNSKFKTDLLKDIHAEQLSKFHKIISSYILQRGKHLFELLVSQRRTDDAVKILFPSIAPYPQKQKKSESYKRKKRKISKVLKKDKSKDFEEKSK